MEEIEVGEYVKLNYGKIDKVKNNDYYMQQYIECEKGLYPRENIVKHSKNIIDLIEVGDYVNGYPVRRIANFNNELCNFDLNTMEWTLLKNIDVYNNILTKEQYQLNCYVVEGENNV